MTAKADAELAAAIQAALTVLMEDGTFTDILASWGNADGALDESVVNPPPPEPTEVLVAGCRTRGWSGNSTELPDQPRFGTAAHPSGTKPAPTAQVRPASFCQSGARAGNWEGNGAAPLRAARVARCLDPPT
ncbi:hypothetical protein NKG05_11495 [Oerskovia sp. M15]